MINTIHNFTVGGGEDDIGWYFFFFFTDAHISFVVFEPIVFGA